MKEMHVRSLDWEDPLEKGMQPIPVFLTGESHGQRRLAGYSPWGRKESDVTERRSIAAGHTPDAHSQRKALRETKAE